MASRYLGTTITYPNAGRALIVGAASGGTLAGGQNAQFVFDDTVYVGQEGKQRLLQLLETIYDTVATARVWPISTTL